MLYGKTVNAYYDIEIFTQPRITHPRIDFLVRYMKEARWGAILLPYAHSLTMVWFNGGRGVM